MVTSLRRTTGYQLPGRFRPSRRRTRPLGLLLAAVLALQPIMQTSPAAAQTALPSASFSGGNGTVSVDGTTYAREGATLTLTVDAPTSAGCAAVTGAHSGISTDYTLVGSGGSAVRQFAFSFSAPAGEATQSVTVQVANNYQAQHNRCNGNIETTTADYQSDNTGPVVSGAVAPAANAAGWRNADATITWTATDAGSGVGSGPTPATDSVTADTEGVTRTATAADRLGNPGTGEVTVKLDKTLPTITGTRSPAANDNGWNNADVTVSFECSDATSGIKSCAGSETVSDEGADQSVIGTAVDNAGNTAKATVAGINIDKTPPTLAGTPTGDNRGNDDWYTGDVTVEWTATDDRSGVAAEPADSTITGEGTALTATRTVEDRAGNSTSADSLGVKIDRTPPVTEIDAPTGWVNTDATISLSATDNLSGVADTRYTVDGGDEQTGDRFTLGEGLHEIAYWSVDEAGNVEELRNAVVRVDKTAPAISHALSPEANAFGWNHSAVEVAFTCTDNEDGSGIASCTGDRELTEEGAGQEVEGTATDNAGNSSTGTAMVNIDLTRPVLTAARDREANDAGWYRDDVTVSFTCSDALSGVGEDKGGTDCPAAVTVAEGADQSVTRSVTDAAGNTAEATESGINVDKTPPTLTGTPDAAGWTNDDVTVTWNALDALSGLASPVPEDSVVEGEGGNLSASASVADKAGNVTHTTVAGIRIDRTAPVTTAHVDEPLASGWYAGDVEVELKAGDALSGVDTTYYTVNDGDPQEYDGPYKVSAKGVNTVRFWSVDHAGNVEDAVTNGNSITLKIDGNPPTITGTRSPVANEDGWNNEPVTVSFHCEDAESGIAADPGCPAPVTVDTPGAGQSVGGSVTDNAGNEASTTVEHINIDFQSPETAASVSPEATEDGWHNGTVEVALEATDDRAGVDATYYRVGDAEEPDAYDGPFAVAYEGATDLTFWSVDKAGNVEAANALQISIDTVKPTIVGRRAPAANDYGWNNGPVTVQFDCEDVGSGIKTCKPEPTVLDKEGQGQSVAGEAIDHAGNRETAKVRHVNIDLTDPTISGAPDRAANGHGWYRDDVTVTWTCDDELSGLASCAPAQTLEDEAAGQKAVGYAADRAGNTARGEVPDINIDKTAPTLVGAPTTDRDNGWYRGDVVIAWAAEDALSGIDEDTRPGNSTIEGEGRDLFATASVSDLAGHETIANSAKVSIDRTAPTTTVDAPEGWTNEDVTLDLEATDNLSGVAATYYIVNEGDAQEGTEVELQGEDEYEVAFWSVDVAGNTEAAKTVTVKIDKTAPTIRHELDPSRNDAGWNRSDVTVTFICADEGGSGLKSCTAPQVVDTEGKDQAVDGLATDHAGNTTPDRAFVSLDKTPPTISGALDRAANDHGWYKDDVTVTFTCGDGLSGIASCTGPRTLGHGADQSVTGTAIDAAENEAVATVDGIDVDKVAPTLTGAADADGWTNEDVTVAWTCDDDLSGIDGNCPDATTVSGEGGNLSTVETVADRAGNSTTTTVDGIKIDRQAPTTTHVVSPAGSEDGKWHTDQATAWLGAEDQPGLSGVAVTYYRVGDAEEQEYDGSIELTGSGKVTVTYWSVDHAGNVEEEQSFSVKIDDANPAITGSRSPAANGHGWNNENVTVSFECDDADSGIATCSDPTTLEDEGADQSVTGTAVDHVGKTASATVSLISIDKTQPRLAGRPTSDANAAGWYNDDVGIAWTAQDGLSGIDEATRPGKATITGEGRHLTVRGSVSDKAGNERTVASQSVNIDRTPPAVSGKPDRDANEHGWYDAPVTVTFTGRDALSGVARTSDAVKLDTDGAGQEAKGWARDHADNIGRATVNGINIDTQAPETTAKVDCTEINGYCTGATATVTLTATDQEDLSGVAEIRYRVNGGEKQVAGSNEVEVTVDLTGSGGASVHYFAVDRAGNEETEQGQGLQFDNVAPVVAADQQPAPNGNGWNNADVTVSFSAEDEEGGSGVDESTITAPVTVNEETDGRVVRGQATDHAGNTGFDEVTVKLDKTAPTISGGPDREPNRHGWYHNEVTVNFECHDDLSRVEFCAEPFTLTANQAEQSVQGKAVDKAGNEAGAEVDGINIDGIEPTLEITGVEDGKIYTLGAVPTAGCEADDDLSGLDGACNTTLTGGTANGVGQFTFTATATDKAGNSTTDSVTYTVAYDHSGFLPPINDPNGPGKGGSSPSTFKANSTVPVKFQLRTASGQVVQAGSMPVFLPPVEGSGTAAPVTETTADEAATVGDTFRWDAKDQQYVYNWKTDRNHGDSNWKLRVRLDDGRTYSVEVGVRK